MEGTVISFKFSVGQAVEYTPIGEKKAGLYKITRQMPKEEQAADLKYRIKSEAEVYERNVLGCQLNSDVAAEIEYATIKRRPPAGITRNDTLFLVCPPCLLSLPSLTFFRIDHRSVLDDCGTVAC